MLFYTRNITPRIQYIVATLLGEDVLVTDDISAFTADDHFKINYSGQRITNNECWIQPYGLLTQTSIEQQTINCFNWNELTVFFATQGDIPFDFFSAAFYLLARYEEYLPHTKDVFGRFAHENSLAYKHQFLNTPIIHHWLLAIQHQFPAFPQKAHLFSYVPTYDIDIAYAYQHHSSLKNAAGFLADFVKGKVEKVLERGKVLNGEQDPFDIYHWLDDLHAVYHLEPIYFFLVATKRKGYDKNLSPFTPAMQQLIQRYSNKAAAIHPSWQSGDDGLLLKQEINTLQIISGKPVTKSRQHYIRMSVPETYTQLLENGIEEDYSMGYGSINGFRASYAQPFYWFNLEKNEQTKLLVHPFCFMDANAIFEQKISASEAGIELQHYYDKVRKVNGQMISIFHNHFLANQPAWLPWRNIYVEFLKNNLG